MASTSPKTYAYTSLADGTSMRLNIDNVDYDIVEYTGSFAINQIPEAICCLSLGRDARNVNKISTINKNASGLKQMLKAQVFFHPKGDYSPDGIPWPNQEVLIFDGYFTGSGFQKVNGKVNYVVNLIHWLVDLTFGSCLSSISHVGNPASLTFTAAIEPITPSAGAGGQAVFLSQEIANAAITPLIQGDIWEALKTMLCGMSQFDGFNPICGGKGGIGLDQVNANNRATRALSRIEGPSSLGASAVDCTLAYKYGKALPLDAGVEQAYAGIAASINYMLVSDLWQLSMWDVMVGSFLPQFGLAICPGIDRAVVVADLPGYRGSGEEGGTMWRDISANDYEFTQQSLLLPRPLRAVVAHGQSYLENGANFGAVASSQPSCVSGVYASDSAEDSDGTIMYVQTPEWIAGITSSGRNGGTVTGNNNGGQPIYTATTTDRKPPAPKDTPPNGMIDAAQAMLDKYAQMVFIREQLRGRNGTISGKLRFDVGPGSHIKLFGQPEIFIGFEDTLADTLFTQANRVTISISAESRRATTAMVLTALRNELENTEDRTSSQDHPFYDENIMLGFPLTPIYDL